MEKQLPLVRSVKACVTGALLVTLPFLILMLPGQRIFGAAARPVCIAFDPVSAARRPVPGHDGVRLSFGYGGLCGSYGLYGVPCRLPGGYAFGAVPCARVCRFPDRAPL